METTLSEPMEIYEVADGWAAQGDGWTVHAPTLEEVQERFRIRARFYAELKLLPPWRERRQWEEFEGI